MPDLTDADKLHSFSFIPPFEDNHWLEIIDEVYIRKVYEPYLPKAHHGICLDIGANVGFTSYYFSRYFDKVYSLEPSKTHRVALERMIKDAKLTNVEVLPYALSHKNGRETFVHNANRTSFSLEKVLDDKTGSEEVETITIDTLVKQLDIKQIDFMKLDIEGSEGHVLTSEGFEKIVPILEAFVFEYHEWTNVSLANLFNIINDYGYAIRKFPTQAQVFGCKKV